MKSLSELILEGDTGWINYDRIIGIEPALIIYTSEGTEYVITHEQIRNAFVFRNGKIWLPQETSCGLLLCLRDKNGESIKPEPTTEYTAEEKGICFCVTGLVGEEENVRVSEFLGN